MRQSPALALAEALQRSGFPAVTEDECVHALLAMESAGYVVAAKIQLGPVLPRVTDGAKQPPSPDEINAARTPGGSWSKRQLAAWGVPWPPPGGWKRELEARWKASQSSQ